MVVGKENSTISFLLNSMNIPDQTQWDHIRTLKSRIPSGANHRTLEFFEGLIGFRENGAVEGRTMTQAAAFKILSRHLDELRRDQLAILLANDARRMERWQDVLELSNELKDNCEERQSLNSELARVIRLKNLKIAP